MALGSISHRGKLLLIAALATICCATRGKASETINLYRDNDAGFEVTLPSEWTIADPHHLDTPDARATFSPQIFSVVQESKKNVRVSFKGPNSLSTGETCSVSLVEAPATRRATFTQIDYAIQHDVLRDVSVNELKAVDPSSHIVSHRIVHVANLMGDDTEIASSIQTQDGKKLPMIVRTLVLPVPGLTYVENCAVVADSYSSLHSAFDGIFQSFKITTAKAQP